MDKMTVSFEVISDGGGTRIPELSDILIQKALQAFLQELVLSDVKSLASGSFSLSLQNVHWSKHQSTMHLDMATYIREKRVHVKESTHKVVVDPDQQRDWGYTIRHDGGPSSFSLKTDAFVLSAIQHRENRKYSRASLDGRIIVNADEIGEMGNMIMDSVVDNAKWIKEKSA